MGKYLGYSQGKAKLLKILNILSDPNFINYMGGASNVNYSPPREVATPCFYFFVFHFAGRESSVLPSLSASSTETRLYLSCHSILRTLLDSFGSSTRVFLGSVMSFSVPVIILSVAAQRAASLRDKLIINISFHCFHRRLKATESVA